MSEDKKPKGAAGEVRSLAGTPGLLGMIMEIFGFGRGIAIATVVVTGVVLALGTVWFVRSAPPDTITFTSGPEGGIFYTTALKYKKKLGEHGVKVNILTSQGSVENIKRLSDPSCAVDVGFVQGGIITNEINISKLVSLGSVAYQPLLVFYRGETVDLLSQFKGKRLSIGAMGSGTRVLATTLLDYNGIKPGGSTTLLDLETEAASQALLDGKVDAVFLMGEAASIATLRKLIRAPGINLMSFPQVVAYTRRLSYLNVLLLPQGGIDFGSNLPSHDIYLIGPTIEFVARNNLHPALTDLLLDAAREIHGNASLLQRKGEFPAPLEHEFRISEDALRFYKSGKSFLYRRLPFWLASVTSRVVVVFVPIVVVMIPMLRSIPKLYRWRIRSRILRWYRALLTLEQEALQPMDAEKRDHLMKQLDQIERAVNRMRMPASYADQYYGLRNHIIFVRERLRHDPL